jgi:hypothetical protein
VATNLTHVRLPVVREKLLKHVGALTHDQSVKYFGGCWGTCTAISSSNIIRHLITFIRTYILRLDIILVDDLIVIGH